LEVSNLGLDAAREVVKKVNDVEFESTNKILDEPKEGKHDDEEHSGGDTYAGGVGLHFIEVYSTRCSHAFPRQEVVAPLAWEAWEATNAFTRAGTLSRYIFVLGYRMTNSIGN